MEKISNFLNKNSYPGRGIIIGITSDNKNVAIAYFIMGRSENSRNRVFSLEGSDLKTEPFKEEKMIDPSLIIYYPVRSLGGVTVVTNGNQTDTIVDYLKEGKTFNDAIRSRRFEPDVPNFTPRISSIIKLSDTGVEYNISIIKRVLKTNNAQHNFYEYKEPTPGLGHFIHTYKKDKNPLPSFEGEPKEVEIVNDIKKFGDEIWDSLDSDNKISLFTRFIEIETGADKTRIINKNY